MTYRVVFLLSTFAFLLTAGVYFYQGSLWYPVYASFVGGRTVQDVVDRYGDAAEARLLPRFAAAGVAYPPQEVTLIGLKEEKQLELWANDGSAWHFVHSYPIQAASGVAGPKLREGDRQVPEGLYRIIGLNPNSSYHLSMKLDYPNAFDLDHAGREGRSQPGSNIFIHGKAVSIGCLAMGDPAIEELFVLVHKVDKNRIRVLISPHDARQRPLWPIAAGLPEWTGELYQQIDKEFANYRKERRP